MITKTATYIRKLEGYRGDARLYQVNPTQSNGINYVVVSAVVASYTGPETYIFPCNEAGEITDYIELEGSFRGELDHHKALSLGGYEVLE
jgi:hypothetical protein